jgi:hypothetical protein
VSAPIAREAAATDRVRVGRGSRRARDGRPAPASVTCAKLPG